MEVRELKQKCPAMPTIYHFRTFEDRPAFFRWRHGSLKVTVGPSGGSWDKGPYENGWRYVYMGGINFLEFPGVSSGEFPEEEAKRFLAALPNEVPANAESCA